MRCIFMGLALVLGACASTASHTAPARCAPLTTAVDARLQSALDVAVDRAVAEGFAGQVAVLRGDTYIYRRSAGAADLEGHAPVTDRTLFHVASISKYFTAALILRAAEEARLALDAPLNQFAPGTHIAARGTTIADLLAHRSGLGSSYAAESQTDSASALAAIDAQPLDPHRIGSFHYSNDGYDLLAIIVERAFGERYETAMRREVLASACVEHAAFWGDGRLTDPRHRGQPLQQPESPTMLERNFGMIGSAGLLITAYELAAYQRALDTGRVLTPAMLAELTAPRDEVDIGDGIGHATFGAFLIRHPRLGRVLSARGYEDWGDNAILNDYLDCDVIVAVTTSRGPAGPADAAFRNQLSRAAESALAPTCSGIGG